MDGFRRTPNFVPVAPSELAILFGPEALSIPTAIGEKALSTLARRFHGATWFRRDVAFPARSSLVL
jgi:hypothetical protein